MEIQNRLNIWRNKKAKKYGITVFKGKQKGEKKKEKEKMIEGWMSKGK